MMSSYREMIWRRYVINILLFIYIVMHLLYCIVLRVSISNPIWKGPSVLASGLGRVTGKMCDAPKYLDPCQAL